MESINASDVSTGVALRKAVINGVTYTSVIDWIVYMFDTNKQYAAQKVQRVFERHAELTTMVVMHKFPGARQRDSPCVDVKGLVSIIMKMQATAPKVKQFQDYTADMIARYMGGDTTMIDEVNALNEMRFDLPGDHPLQIFGEYVDERSRARATAIDAYHGQVQAIQGNLATNHLNLHIVSNALVSRSVLGSYPKDFKASIGVKNTVSSRNYMSEAQLKGVALAEVLVAQKARTTENTSKYLADVKDLTDDFFALFEKHNIHGTHCMPALPKPIHVSSNQSDVPL